MAWSTDWWTTKKNGSNREEQFTRHFGGLNKAKIHVYTHVKCSNIHVCRKIAHNIYAGKAQLYR